MASEKHTRYSQAGVNFIVAILVNFNVGSIYCYGFAPAPSARWLPGLAETLRTCVSTMLRSPFV